MSRQSHFLSPLLRASGQKLGLYSLENRLVAADLESAFDSKTRKRGLLGRENMGEQQALIIAPCTGVHTFRMRFPIDVIYAARDGRILKLRPNMIPGRISVALKAFATIEMAIGGIERAGLRV